MKKSTESTFSVAMPAKMKKEIEKIAKENDRSVSFVIRKACESYLAEGIFDPQGNQLMRMKVPPIFP